jgi:hypothetical protein
MFAPFEFNLAAQLWTVTYIAMFVAGLFALAFTVKGQRRMLLNSIAVLYVVSISLLDGVESGYRTDYSDLHCSEFGRGKV